MPAQINDATDNFAGQTVLNNPRTKPPEVPMTNEHCDIPPSDLQTDYWWDSSQDILRDLRI